MDVGFIIPKRYVYEKVQKLSLTILYKKNPNFRKWVRQLLALPWLPEEEIYPVYLSLEIPITDLVDSEKAFVKALRTLFSKTWLSRNNPLSVFYYEKATNNGAESYHKKLRSYLKGPHPNIWRFVESLNNVISDYDLELERLSKGEDTTRAANSITKAKTERRKELRENLLNQTCTPLEYLDSMEMTIGISNFHADMLTVPINDISDISMTDSTNDELNNDHCYVCLLPRPENFALLHDQCVHADFCYTCANHLFERKANCPTAGAK